MSKQPHSGNGPAQTSANFSFLATYDVQLVRLAALAERYFKDDPATSLIKLRQYGETLAQLVAAKAGLFRDTQEAQTDLLRRLRFERVVPDQVGNLFHHLRVVGNKATHENNGTHAEALSALKMGRELGVWFHRTFGAQKGFSAGPFVPPPDPGAATQALAEELARLRDELDKHRTVAEEAHAEAAEIERARLGAEEKAQKEREERAIWEQLAAEAEQAKAALARQLQALQAAAALQPTAQLTTGIAEKAADAAAHINIDEASTRSLIDEQLRARGWEVDTQSIRYASGYRQAAFNCR
jgi:type I restriction enzyme, R subunit